MGARPGPTYGPRTQKGPVLCLTVCCHLEILTNFQTKGFRFHLTWTPTNYAAGIACRVFLTYKVKPDFEIPWNLPHF